MWVFPTLAASHSHPEIRSNVSAKPAYQNEVKNKLAACVVGISFVIDVILLGYAIQDE